MFFKLRGAAAEGSAPRERSAPIPLEEALSRRPAQPPAPQEEREEAAVTVPVDYPFLGNPPARGGGGGAASGDYGPHRYDPSSLLPLSRRVSTEDRSLSAADGGVGSARQPSLSSPAHQPPPSAVRRAKQEASGDARSVSFSVADSDPQPREHAATLPDWATSSRSPSAHQVSRGTFSDANGSSSVRQLIQRPMPVARTGKPNLNGGQRPHAPVLQAGHDFTANPCGLFVSTATVVAAFSTSEMAATLATARRAAGGTSKRKPSRPSSDSDSGDEDSVELTGPDDFDRGGVDGAEDGAIQPGLVASVECGGWLRMRDLIPSSNDGSKGIPTTGASSSTFSMSLAREEEGMIRYQCRLSRGNEASCACWAVGATASPHPQRQKRAVCLLVVGLLGGGLACYRVAGESLMELQSVPWAAAPVTQVHTLLAKGHSAILSTSSLGDLALWAVSPLGLRCVAQTASCGVSVNTVATVCHGNGSAAAARGGDGSGFFLYSNVVPVGYEEELVQGAVNAFLVECRPAAGSEEASWHLLKVFAAPASEGEVHCLCEAPAAAQLWAGTSTGSLLVWDTESCALFRRVALPASSPAHSLSLATSTSPAHALSLSGNGGGTGFVLTPLPDTVWACQISGEVTAWETGSFTLLQQLTVSYPPLASSSGGERGKRASARRGGGGDEAGGVIVVEDAVDLTRVLCENGADGGDSPSPLKRKSHFTMGVMALEPVVAWRTWSTATDGTVRSWLVPATTTTATAPMKRANECGEEDSGDMQSGFAAPPLDPEVVRDFLHAKAEELAAARAAIETARAAHEAEVSALKSRNETLAAALKEATARLQEHMITAEERETKPAPRRAYGSGGGDSGAGLASGPSDREAEDVHVPPPLPHRDLLPSPPTANLARLLQSLRGKLEDSIADKSTIQQELLAYRLRNLDDSAAAHDARDAATPRDGAKSHRRHRHAPSSSSGASSSSSSSATASCTSEDIALVEAWSSTPVPILGGGQRPQSFTPLRRQTHSGNGRGSAHSTPSAYGNGSTILAPVQHLHSPYYY